MDVFSREKSTDVCVKWIETDSDHERKNYGTQERSQDPIRNDGADCQQYEQDDYVRASAIHLLYLRLLGAHTFNSAIGHRSLGLALDQIVLKLKPTVRYSSFSQFA